MPTNRRTSMARHVSETTRDPEERRRLYLEGLSSDYANLRKDSKVAANLDEESALWDSTTGDGLNED